MPRRTCVSGDTMIYSRLLSSLRLLALLLFLSAAGADDTENQCDWNGSGLGSGRGVVAVYLRCRWGTVGWSYPAGALRLLLRLPGGGDFRACLRPAPAFPQASLFLEAPRSLIKLYSPEDAHLRHIRCFHSRGGQAALYLEAADPGGSRTRQVAEFSYDLTPLPRGASHQPGQECRPCTKEEMTQAFCTSELVVRGIIQRVEPIEDTDISQIHLRVTKTLRESPWWEDNEADSASPGGVTEGGEAVVDVGRECGASHGGGEIVLMARRRLGRPLLLCAPRTHEWAAIVKESANSDTTHCLLTS